MCHKGLILLNATYMSADFDAQCQRISSEFDLLGIKIDVMHNDFFPASISSGKVEVITSDYDFIIYYDKDIYIASLLRSAGHKLFNSPKAIHLCDDKMHTHIALSNSDIMMPNTMPFPLIYDEKPEYISMFANQIANKLGFPLIVKKSASSLGRDVIKVDTLGELQDAMCIMKKDPHIYQEYIDTDGQDYRVVVIGGQIAGCMKRSSGCGFIANIASGGTGESVPLPQIMQEYALKASEALGLDFCGIDFLVSKSGQIYLNEVNSNALMLEFEKTTGVNVFEMLARHIQKKVY